MSTPQNAVTAEAGNSSATIHARVGDSAIDKVTRLFSAGLADIFTETLQNSRRGGANRVAATIEQDGDTTRVTLADDGVGIADPAVLLTFGESGWKDGIAEAEDPAGFGLLALSRRGCTLRWRVPGQDPSPGCRLVLEPAHFLGRDAAHVVPDDSAPWPHGTAVTFEASEAPHAVRAFLETAARHYPLPVTIDGETVARRAFLDGALHVEPWKGLVFGVFKDSHAGYRIPDVNFHGLTLPVRLPLVDTVEGGVWSARADIDSCPDLELVLPARKEAVETPFLEEMREVARLAVYRAIAQADAAPRVAWTDWHKAKEAGIELPEPPVELRPWRPAIADTDYWDERSAFTAVGSGALVMQADPEPPEAQALHRALGLAGFQGGSERTLKLFAPEPRFEGYPWYDALARVTGIETRVTVDGAVRSLDSFLDRENGGEPERPEDIVMHLNVLHPTKSAHHCFRKCDTIAVPADLAFAGEAWSSLHDALPLVTADSEIAPEELARLLRAAFFSPSDDADADSWETQLTRFEEDALHMSLRLMCSVEEARQRTIAVRYGGKSSGSCRATARSPSWCAAARSASISDPFARKPQPMPSPGRRHNNAFYPLSPIRRPRRATNLWSQSRWRSGCGRQQRPCTRAHSGSWRHRTAAGRLIAGAIHPSQTACLAPLRAGAGFRPADTGPGRGCIPMTDIREDHSMKLFTEEQRTKLLANGTRRGPDHEPVVKLFNPCGAGTWLLSELDPEYPNECAFGLADLGFGTPELGSIGLLELTECRGPFGLGIERDIHFTAAFPLSIYAEAARAAGHIVESGPELEAAARILTGMPADAAGSAKPANRPWRTGTVSSRTAFHRRQP